jgi:hypothetical protein
MKKQHISTGSTFGRWTILGPASDAGKKTRWQARCQCGTLRDVSTTHLLSGKSASCGCARKGVALTHGDAKTRTHSIWLNMKARCLNPRNASYPDYGGRGIKVCDRWLDYEAFRADMGRSPEGMSIERRDNNGNYEPGNCHWATIQEQANNRRNNTRLTLNGRTQTIAQWARELGVSESLLSYRVQEGWDDTRILTEPSLKTQRRRLTLNGETATLAAWARKRGIPYNTLLARQLKGWTDAEVLEGRADG